MPYFDHNATTPLAPVAREAWLQVSAETWHNPASPYRDGARARIRLDAVRARLAEFIGCAPELLVFTSGATEGANAVLAHWAQSLPAGSRVAINPTEHPCVLESAKKFFGDRLLWLPVTRAGLVEHAVVKTFFEKHRVAAVIVLAANNETGVLQPWAEIARTCALAGVEYFCDAAQWLGKLPAAGLGGAGWVIGAAHKFGGPKGTGFLKIPVGAESFRAQLGGAQQRGFRGGTEDLAGASAMVAALTDAEQKKVFQESERLRWRGQFEQTVRSIVPGVTVIAAEAERLWNTVSLLMPHTENHRWVTRLDKLGFQVSTGSACATAKEGSSHVLAAMGYAPAEAKRVIRVSSGWETTEAEWNALALALSGLESEFRADNGNVIKI
ncbi:MAG: aminotransferase class V-fold PLP-dependent enzyme [Verrucomicrobia bacterium]|nr:aminotransferase class V-fold PLP-dependent enzyme [Verrucomicrobiota bacterium]